MPSADLTPSPSTYDDVRDLRVVRRFLPTPIPEGTVTAILEAARWTGSSKNRQSWAFVILDDPADIAAVATAGSFAQPVRDSVLTVALVRTPDGNDFDIGRAGQNLMLAAAAHGIGSCPVTLHDGERAREVLELPEDHECRWVVAPGYPDVDAEESSRQAARSRGMRGRRSLSDLTHRGRFGG